MNKIEPKIANSNLSDFLIFFIVGALQLGILLALPSYCVYLFTGSAITAYAFAIALYFVFLLFCALSITFCENGIKLNRWFGSQKNIPWSDIEDNQKLHQKK